MLLDITLGHTGSPHFALHGASPSGDNLLGPYVPAGYHRTPTTTTTTISILSLKVFPAFTNLSKIVEAYKLLAISYF